ncbi:MAG: amidohydrolase family protein, partial [Alphaproteobacteria bacterium]|nr:amidohydrolase family protein [Alphaproteobacteria bacterium]
PAFTSNVADLLRLRRKGRLAAGMDADLILFDQDFSIRHVLVKGRWHKFDYQQVKKGSFEP